MALQTYIVRRGGTYYYRIRVPRVLVPLIGKSELRQALWTSSPAVAKSRAAPLHAGVVRMMERARMVRDQDELVGIQSFMRTAAEHMRRQAAEFGGGVPPEMAMDLHAAATEATAAVETVERLGTANRLEAMVEAMSAQLAALKVLPAMGGTGAADPFEGLVEEAHQPWHQHLEKFFEEAGFAEATVKNYSTTYSRLRVQIGDKATALVTGGDLVAFMENLVATGKARQGRTTVAADTQNKHASALKAFFGWAKSKRLCKENIGSGLCATRAAKKEAAKFQKRPFTAVELKTLFSYPLFSGSKSDWCINRPGEVKVRDHRFWLPLVALFTGGRRNELAQVLLSDITNFDGIDYIFIRIEVDEEEDTAEEIAASRSLKTQNAKRCIPIHPELKRIGFMEYMARRRKEVGPGGLLFEKFGYGQLYNQRVLPKAGIKDIHTSFHSLRHNFKNAVRALVNNEELQNRLMGHAPKGSGGRYGDPLTPDEVEAFFKVCNWRVDLSHLYAK